jgi:exodeoxyribonuclease V beta subunit
VTATFDLCGPLPTGTTVLEASAGTGKTHTIAALAARYIAEGSARVDELMLVTFGRAATVELRERVRERLVGTAAALARPEDARCSADEVVRLLATGSDEQVDVRRARLAHAVANFDAATIATTHGFCHQMLAGLGVAADVDPDVAFTESISDVVSEVVGDLYLRAYARPDSPPPPFGFRVAAQVANDAVFDRQARLEPVDAAPDSEPDVRRRLAAGVREEVDRRKRLRRVMDYDDLLVHLRSALADPETGEDARARVRSRYRVVLVDEFQDTDPVQWDILERAFHGRRTLVLIGDPKQAIYAFRGADVVTYLLATGSAEESRTLGTNWRSDQPLVQALEQVMGGVALGDERIKVHPVDAATKGRRLDGAPVDAPLRLRVVDRDELPTGRGGVLSVKDVRPYVARDVASDIVRLLGSGARLHDGQASRPVQPADIAVLVQRNEDGATIRDCLEAVRVPVVLTGTSSVFGSHAADDWLTLLAALEQPHRPGLARAAALTSFVGWSAERLAADDDEALDELGARLHEWADLLTHRGVAALLEVLTGGCGLVERVLATEHGERFLTDLRHIGQALHAAATEGQLGVASLVEWLQRRIAEARDDVSEERSRRLESDAEAVQVITVHRSKGLEFPVVYVPFLWDKYVRTSPDPLHLHDPSGARVLDVGGPRSPGYPDRAAVHLAEDAGESLRLAYVALTRAGCQVVAHWAPAGNTRTAPLHRFLFGDRAADGSLPDAVAVGTDEFVRRRLAELADGSAGTIAVERADGGSGIGWQAPAPTHQRLDVRLFDRALDVAWTRTSYSGLTAGLHEEPAHRGVSSEAEDPGTIDEPDLPTAAPETPPGGPSTGDDLPSPMADLPRGAAFGTLVHQVLEVSDFSAADLRAQLREQCEALGSERYAGISADQLSDALVPALRTPLGPLAGGRRLADVRTADRLDELSFEMPMLGGDRPSGEARVGQIADLLTRHLTGDDPLRGYADDLAVPLLAARRLRGFLNGSIDLVLRVREDGAAPRYLVVDYKTNWLGGEHLTTADYRPAAMAEAMRAAHYPLQALLYSVALHRFLRWRQPGYDPGTHLGGVLYLFLRGMAGPQTPVHDEVPCGVFSWSPPAALVADLSDLLDRGAP